jgi:predicted ATPase/DNA-binding winged helix-turn-helix (wHTH) protein
MAPRDEAIAFGPFLLLPGQALLLESDRPVRLGSRAMEILTALAERPGEVISKEELIARVWPDTVVEESNLKVHVSALRKVLGDDRAGSRYIANVPGRGYRFVAQVSQRAFAPLDSPLASVSRVGNLPAILTRVLGRADVVSAIASRLSSQRLVTIVGPGGIGKTTVGLAVAHDWAHSHEDGAQFADLASVKDGSFVASALASSFGVAVYANNAVPALMSFLANKRMLIVLDSCEHVVEAAAALAEQLLKSCAELRILGTSREPLRAPGEHVVRLAPLSLPVESEDITAADAVAYSAIQLFIERASASHDTFDLSDINAPVVADICKRLDGNALAIELAAGRVDAFGLRGVAEALDDRFRLLRSQRRTALRRHRTLGATLDWSYDLLSEGERTLLRRLSVLAGLFSLDAARAVGAGDDIESAEVSHLVAELVAKSLVAADITGDVASYRLLDTTRAYALAKLAQTPESREIARRHASHYLDVFSVATDEDSDRSTVEWVRRFARHVDNVRAALDWTFSDSGELALGVALTIATVPLWVSLSLMDECRRRVERALAVPANRIQRTPQQEMQLQTALGVALYSFGPGAAAKAAWSRVLSMSEELRDTDHRLRALWGLWVVGVTGGRQRPSLALAKRFRDLACNCRDGLAEPVGERLIGTSLHFLGEHERGLAHLERSSRQLNDTERRSHVVRFQFDQVVAGLAYVAKVLWILGRNDEAIRSVEQCIEEATVLGHSSSLCYALASAACPIALWTGDLEAAERHVVTLLGLSHKHALSLWRIIGHRFRGALEIRRGRAEEGIRALRDSASALRDAGFVLYYTTAVADLAEGLGVVGRVAEGLDAINDALDQSRRHEELWHLPELLRIRSGLLLQQQKADSISAAEVSFKEALDCATQQKALAFSARAATALARLLHDQGRPEQALAVLDHAAAP